MRTRAPLTDRPPSRFWSLGGTLVAHAALAALLWRAPPPPRVLSHTPPTVEFSLRFRKPPPPLSIPEPPSQPLMPPRLPIVHTTPPVHTPPVRSASASSGVSSGANASASAHASAAPAPVAEDSLSSPAQPEAPRDLRGINLLPSGVLRGVAEGADSGPGPQGNAARADISARGATQRLVQERVQGWLDGDAGRYRASSGAVDPLWRELERNTKDLFQPPESLVRSGQSSMTVKERLVNQVTTIAKQVLTSPQRVEHGLLPRGEFAERGPMGMPEDSYRNGMAAQQQKAVMDAWKTPASWRRTEVELVMTASGEVESVKVVSSCGVPKLDRVAAEAVEKAARSRRGAYTGKRTITRWAMESAYAANPLHQVGFTFDETGQMRKNARGIQKYFGDPMYLVGGQVKTRISLISLLEPRSESALQ